MEQGFAAASWDLLRASKMVLPRTGISCGGRKLWSDARKLGATDENFGAMHENFVTTDEKFAPRSENSVDSTNSQEPAAKFWSDAAKFSIEIATRARFCQILSAVELDFVQTTKFFLARTKILVAHSKKASFCPLPATADCNRPA